MIITQIVISSFSKLFFLGLFLFTTGLGALLVRQKSLILVLMALELALLGLSLLFLLNSILTATIEGQLVVFILLTLGGAESALGLALLMLYFNIKSNINLNVINDLKF